jgi:hypothetical protein
VSTPAEYREQAAECLRLSSAANDPGAKADYVTLAQAWIALASLVEGRLSGIAEAASRLISDPSS